eukprot:TRINITY_DN75131_c0_g1_i1.p1 TRINITY_DN75131_c0_g1~~TRINITY_DN75131_c0_g1_i1.p1  ORF type:complete len:705 (+),score=70.83 TRINITY_DN75131_c0_g1_i1:34-2148(+)
MQQQGGNYNTPGFYQHPPPAQAPTAAPGTHPQGGYNWAPPPGAPPAQAPPPQHAQMQSAPAAPYQASSSSPPPRPASPVGPGAATADEMRTPVELTISCTNLIDMDTFSKSDPFVVVYESNIAVNTMISQQQQQGKMVQLGKTEVVWDNLNPHFTTPINVDYHFETNQTLIFKVYDMDDAKKGIEAQDFIGEAQTTLAQIVQNRETNIKLANSKWPQRNVGNIQISCEERTGGSDIAVMVLSARGLAAKNWGIGAKSDPMLEIARFTETNKTQPVVRTEPIMNTLECCWKPIKVTMQRLCGGDAERPLQLAVYDYERMGDHKLIGTVQTSFSAMTEGAELELRDKRHKQVGTLHVHHVRVDNKFTFLDYVRTGFEISMVVGIDFTASNGAPDQPQSLHYKDPYNPNQYLRAIMSVCDIVSQYDKEGLFPVYGFGAKLPDGSTSHCFPCTLNSESERVQGVQGIMDVYAQALQQVRLFGPTLFAPLINRTAQLARSRNDKYYILLILTDGAICDMDATIDAIVEASELPMSIIIVGIGSADFGNMDILDADDTPLRSRQGKLMSRDIVQFVPMKDFVHAPFSALARETLIEVPEQFTGWAQRSRVPPHGKEYPKAPTAPHQKTEWQPDSSTKRCMVCHQKFTMFFRRHHCRYCGKVCCQVCTEGRAKIVSMNYNSYVRVCRVCMEAGVGLERLGATPYGDKVHGA